ncbi:hypothetical protein CRYUN_Cryun01aG0222300 [Craigia yunnanensis]
MIGVTFTKHELINGTTPKPSIIQIEEHHHKSLLLWHSGRGCPRPHGACKGPTGRAKAPRGVQRPMTMRMNITVDIITDRLLASPNLVGDVSSGTLTMSSYSRIGGRVNMLNMIKKHVTVKTNCSMTVNISSQAIQEQKCKRKVDL